MRTKEEEYREAYLLWKDENQDKTHVPQSTIVTLSSGKKVNLGKKISLMKAIYESMQEGKKYRKCRDLTEEDIAWWTEQGVDLGKRHRMSYTEEEYQEAYLLWKKENSELKNVPHSLVVELPNGKKVPLGNRVNRMKTMYQAMQNEGSKGLTEEKVLWWTEHGLDLGIRIRTHYSEEIYHEAYLLWKKKHSEADYITNSTVVTLPNGNEIPLGRKIKTMRMIYRAMQEGKRYGNYPDLKKEEIAWWKENGIDLSKKVVISTKEEEYREAYLLWKNENPDKTQVPNATSVKISNGKVISLGGRISIMKMVYSAMQEGKHYKNSKDLTEEQIAWWTSYGIDLGKRQRQRYKESEYREAYLLWKERNPEENHVYYLEVVTLPSGKNVPIGTRIQKMKSIYKAMQEGRHCGKYKDLTEEQIAWWKGHGLDFFNQSKTENASNDEKQEQINKNHQENIPLKNQPEIKHNKYQEAYLLWKKDNQDVQDVPFNLVVELPNGKKVSLGRRIDVMKSIYRAMKRGNHFGTYKDLTEEEILWWTEQRVSLERTKRSNCTEEEYREAYLLWKQRNPKAKFISSREFVVLPNGIKVFLGNRINMIKSAYEAIQEGKENEYYKDITEEDIAWWLEQGLSLEKTNKSRRKKKNTQTIRQILTEFQIDFPEFIQSIEVTRTKKMDVAFSNHVKEQTLRTFCRQAGYNYYIVSKAIKLHSLLKDETLEQLIKRILEEKKSKKEVPSWIFEVYGSNIESVLLALNLNPKQILKSMREKIIPIEEAMCHSIFLNTCKEGEYDYLGDIYKRILVRINFQASEEENAEKIVDFIVKMGKMNHLMNEEIEVLKKCFINYLQTVREYQIIDVGLEGNEEKKKEKIKQYNFTEEEIEESYFVPFRFEEGILLEEKSELYKRRELLRQYIIDWDYYTGEEKQEVKEEQHLTEEEFSVMEKLRKEINQMTEGIQKIKK